MIEFRKVDPEKPKPASRRSITNSPFPITLTSKLEIEDWLFHFLLTLRDGRPQAIQPLAVETATLHDLYTTPHPDLVEALRQCLDNLLIELSPNAAQWGKLALSPTIWGVAMAAHNCLLPTFPRQIADFTTALLDTLSPARTQAEALVYHALLKQPSEALPHLSDRQADWMQALINRSPLTAVYHLHHYTPPPLTALAAELLPGWRRRVVDPKPWVDLAEWLDVVALLLQHPTLAMYLRYRWLALPETRSACRNLGLLLEALRCRGGQRAVILEFYEAYEYFKSETDQDEWGRPIRRWPLLAEIERLLRVGSDIDPANETAFDAALHLNRYGNEYFLKFRPLVQLIITEGHPPNDYYHLHDLPQAIRPLLNLTTDSTDPGLEMGSIQFGSQET